MMVWLVNPDLVRHISKTFQKTKLPGKTSWKVSIWHFISYEWLFPKKIQFATLSKSKFQHWFCFNYSSRSLVVYFSLKHSKTFCIQYCLWVLACFHEKPFYFNFLKFQLFNLVCCCHFCNVFFVPAALLFTDRRVMAKQKQSNIKVSFLG